MRQPGAQMKSLIASAGMLSTRCGDTDFVQARLFLHEASEATELSLQHVLDFDCFRFDGWIKKNGEFRSFERYNRTVVNKQDIATIILSPMQHSESLPPSPQAPDADHLRRLLNR